MALCAITQLAASSWQQAELEKESGVRIQNPGGKKHKGCPSLLATGYFKRALHDDGF